MKKLFNIEKLLIFLLVLLCLVIIFIWFKDRYFLATGEDSLIFANPDRALAIFKYSWQEVVSGEASPGWNARIPLLYAESVLLKIGMPLWFFQASLFFLLMVGGSISTYLLSKELFHKLTGENLKIRLAFIAGIFYILNPISLLSVWDRGIAVYSFIFFYALLPLFLYFYILGLKKKKVFFIIAAPLVTLIYSGAFSSAAEPFLLWLLPFIYSVIIAFDGTTLKAIKFKGFPIVYFVSSFVFWVLISLWWIFPWIRFSNTEYFSKNDTLQYSINTLKANSQDFSLINVIRLIHGGFLFRSEAFGPIYKNPIFEMISWLIPIFTFYGFLKLKRSQLKLFFALSLIILLFSAKGTSFPFGGVFLFFFSHISVMQIFRNTFEKIGMVLPLIYAPLFSYGLLCFLSRYLNRKNQIFLFLLAIICLMVYNWPFFTGALVNFRGRDIRVEVPNSFKEANRTISEGNHIILSVPIMGGASGLYKWQYGFKGIEAGQYLFDYPVVGALFNADTFYGQMLIGMSNGNLSNLVGLAQIFSADIIVFRKDTDLKAYGYNFDAIERVNKMITDADLSQIFDSNEVSLWNLPKEKIVPILYIPNSLRLGDSPQELISLLEKNQYDPKHETFICSNENKCNPFYKLSEQSLIKLDKVPEKMEINKMSPVDYQIKIYQSLGRFLLVFNENYDPGWVVFINGVPLTSNRHIIANGYANGFIIDQIGNFEISLQFAPEQELQKAYKISLLFIFLGTVALLFLAISQIKKRR